MQKKLIKKECPGENDDQTGRRIGYSSGPTENHYLSNGPNEKDDEKHDRLRTDIIAQSGKNDSGYTNYFWCKYTK
mgnify:CR=1 FL=1